MQRRQFLAGGAVLLSAAIAGCESHPDVVLEFRDAPAGDVTGEVSNVVQPGTERHAIVTAASEDNAVTWSGRNALFEDTSTVQADDAFYDVTETRVGSSEGTVYEVHVDLDPDTTTPEIGEIHSHELPAADRERLGYVFSGDTESRQDGGELSVDYGTAALIGDESVFVPDQQYDVVASGGDRYRVSVTTETASLQEFRYDVTEVAPDVEAFAEQLRAQYQFTLEGLSDAEQSVVEEAIESAYYDDDDAFQSVVDRLREHEGLNVEEDRGTWLVEYEGEGYRAYVEE